MDRTAIAPPADVLTEEQAAGLLLISPRTLQDWRFRSKGPPFFRVGSLVRYRRGELLDWCEIERASPEAPAAPRPLTPPVFQAYEVSGVDGTSGHLATWCPWCERIHRHGAGGGAGHRAPHCHDLSNSPLRRTGYDLALAGSEQTERDVAPGGAMVGHQRLYEAANRMASDLRNQTVRVLTGLARPGRNAALKQFAGGSVTIFFQEGWRIERKDGSSVNGGGLLRLAAELYGVPVGVAAVRILEAATAETLDAEAALGLQRVIDDWVARGAPKRGAAS